MHHFVYIVLCKMQRLEARQRAKLDKSKIATKPANKTLSNALL